MKKNLKNHSVKDDEQVKFTIPLFDAEIDEDVDEDVQNRF